MLGVHPGAQGTSEDLAELRHVGEGANHTESVGAVTVLLLHGFEASQSLSPAPHLKEIETDRQLIFGRAANRM